MRPPTICYDVETNSLSCVTPDIVLYCYKINDGEIQTSTNIQDIKKYLEDPKYIKIAHNAKFEIQKAKAHGIKTVGQIFDTKVAAYILNTERPSNGLKQLAQAEFRKKMTTYEEVCGTGKKEVKISQVSPDIVKPYCMDDVRQTYRLYELYSKQLKEQNMEKVFYELEMKLVPVIAEMEIAGIGLDEAHIKEFHEELTRELDAEKVKLAAFGDINWGSPKQLREFLFKKLKLPTKGIKKTKIKKELKTDRRALELLAPLHEVPKILLEYKHISKIKSTYTLNLLEKVNPVDGKLHCGINQTVTATTRLSSSRPNSQNLTKVKDKVKNKRDARGNKVRKSFIAPPGHKLISGDFSQIEPRVMAHLSNDPKLIDLYINDQDIYNVIGRVIHEPDRDKNKVVLLAIMYEMTKYGLSQSINVNENKAQGFIDGFHSEYVGVYHWKRKTLQEVRKCGYVTTLFGHKRFIKGINSEHDSFKATAERESVNTPIQGSAAGIMKLALIKLKANPRLCKYDMPLTVHDEALMVVPDADVPEAIAEIRKTMENCIKLRVPVKVDIAVGQNWAQMEAVI